MLRDFFKFGKKDKTHNTKEEKKLKLAQEEEERSLAKDIALRLSNSVSTSVKEIMIPRIDMTTIALGAMTSRKELVRIIKESGHSRIPVWDKSVDDIVGVLYVKDLFHLLIKGKPEPSLKSVLRSPFFIPESTNIFVLLKDFQAKKVHLAVVVDEYGGVSGIVALEDILEEIVGEIRDEYDVEEGNLIESVGDGVYNIGPRVSLEELNLKLEVKLPDDHSDTVGGFMFDLFGRIPNEDETIKYETDDKELEFKILSIDGNKIEQIKLSVTIKNITPPIENNDKDSLPPIAPPPVY